MHFELFLHILFDLLATLVLFLTVFAQNCIDSLLDRLLVTLFTNLDELTDNNVLKLVLVKVKPVAVVNDLRVGNNFLLELATKCL